MRRTLRIAAIQLHSEIGDVKKNLLNCEQLADAAGKAGAKWIVLPEFFTTGMGFTPQLKNTALPADGPATELLLSIARRYQANVGGSFLCRDADFHIRNAFLLASPTGIVGRHSKDEPTLWENCWYIGGADDGRLDVNGIKVGVALCAELGRTATAKRLSGVDLVLAGSYTWHLPDYFPGWLGRHRLDRKLFSEISSWHRRSRDSSVPPSLKRLIAARSNAATNFFQSHIVALSAMEPRSAPRMGQFWHLVSLPKGLAL